ncbi:MAG: helicase-associated domain-containing protein [Clostridiales bacterium]|jgi:DNA excision repair protein ERCC-3|nr:helicase-associated domain-containing protein [Clostridiales bacterium]
MTIVENPPLIVQSDMTVLLETSNPNYEEARDELASFAEMIKSPEYFHTYKITPLSLWNAASAGVTSDQVIASLEKFSKYDIPELVKARVIQISNRYGKVRVVKIDGELYLETDDEILMIQMANEKTVAKYFIADPEPTRVKINPIYRGHIKQALMNLQFPPEDLAGYAISDSLDISLKLSSFSPRPYQNSAVSSFFAGGKGGHGVIVLPCGAGKTIVGLIAMSKLNTETLILTTSITAVRQWINELVEKTNIDRSQIGEYSGEKKEILPVTVSTYQILSSKNKEEEQKHFQLFSKRNWGFIVYDEVHTLPAPVFRITAELQAKRRLGLTATLVREDGLETDVFALIGPKRHELGWKVLEKTGFIASAECYEMRIKLPDELRMPYALAPKREKFRISAENPLKLECIRTILRKHQGAHILIIGQYIDQLRIISDELNAPIITGKVSNSVRERIYNDFKTGKIMNLVVSKVANFAIDLPDANVAIEISGAFGSRQEEAQRLGRILRPKPGENKAYFYALVTADSREEDFSAHRQLFLVEQGYPYKIIDWDVASSVE